MHVRIRGSPGRATAQGHLAPVFARDAGFPGTGRLLLLDALARSLRHSKDVAAAAVLVDAKDDNAHGFYARYGFQEIAGDPSRMFLPMKTVAEVLAAGD